MFDYVARNHRYMHTLLRLRTMIKHFLADTNRQIDRLTGRLVNLGYAASHMIPRMQFDLYSLPVSNVHLVGGAVEYEGRVEIYRMGEWGTVCDHEWDFNDATVVCRQLGYSRAVSARLGAYYGQGSGKIWMDGVRCRGNEIELQQCPFSSWKKYNCDHSRDVGVICGKSMSNYQLKLTNVCRNVHRAGIMPVGTLAICSTVDFSTVVDIISQRIQFVMIFTVIL